MANKRIWPRCYYSWLPADKPNHIHDMYYFAVNRKEALEMHRAKGGNNTQCMVWDRQPPIMLPAGSVVKCRAKESPAIDL